MSTNAHHTFDVGAELAFWALLALFPFLILVLTFVGYLPLEGLRDEVIDTLNAMMPEQAARVVTGALDEVVGRQRGWLLAAALAGALWSASSGVAAAMSALNRAYDVPNRTSYIRRKVLSIVVTLIGAILSVIATACVLVGPLVERFITLGGRLSFLYTVGRWLVALATMLFTLACFYYFLPNVKNNRFRFISPGAVVAVVCWVGASVLFNLYVSHFDSYAKTYGALGAPVVLMLWLYLSGLAIVLGGEVNALLDRRALGRRHEPKDPISLERWWRELAGWLGRRRGSPAPSTS